MECGFEDLAQELFMSGKGALTWVPWMPWVPVLRKFKKLYILAPMNFEFPST